MEDRSWLAIFLLSLASCVRYQADHRYYTTSAGALAAFDERTAEIVNSLQPRDVPLGDSARVMVPSREHHLMIAAQGRGPENIVSYIASINEHFVDSFPQAMRRRALFHSLAVSQSSDVEDPPPSEGVVIWFAWLHRQQAGWWVRNGAHRQWVSIDVAQSDRAAQLKLTLQRLEQALETVGQ